MTSTDLLAPRAKWLVACAVLTLALGGCKKTPAATESARVELSSEARSSIDRALSAYDEVASKLSKDETGAVSADAEELERASEAASKSAPSSLRPMLDSLSAAAGALQRADQNDPNAVRTAFGEVSRAAIALVQADSSLSKGRQVYECSMTEGYGKWMQTTDKIANPYMGSRMLECGVEVAWDARP